MHKLHIVGFLLIMAHGAYSQIKFETGYIINTEGDRIDCFIKNKGWGENPTEIEYKLHENSESKLVRPDAIKEFGVDNSIRYISALVKIDRSPGQLDKLTTFANPIFEEEELFLKVLIEGKANLYSYENGKIRRFFFNVGESPIEQLIFKLYKESHNKVSENNRFRQQLWNSLVCPSVERKTLENINYNKSALIRVFSLYNSCSDSEFTRYDRKDERELFRISIRPRWKNSSLEAKNYIDRSFDFDWGNKSGFGLGVEGEVFLGFKKNKWSLVIEPTYQAFSGQTSSADHTTPGSAVIATLNYKSVELPIGVRHYFFINPQNRIFINAAYVLDFTISDSHLEITRPSGYRLSHLEIDGGNNFAFGVGYQYKAFGIEARYHTPRDPLNRYLNWTGTYENVSVALGYSIVKRRR